MQLTEIKDTMDIIKYRVEKNDLELEEANTALVENSLKTDDLNEAITILSVVLATTQEGVIHFIEDIVTQVLIYVYGDDYKFEMEYEVKRNQPEISLMIKKGGIVYEPKYSCGVGVLDVVSFALRYACWALMDPRPQSIMIHDEPFKHISGQEQMNKVAEMVTYLSDLLGIQIIMVSAKGGLTSTADKIFSVTMEDNVSNMEVLDAHQ